MNRYEFLAALSAKLSDLSPSDQRRVTDFYSEMIDDRIEEGLTEEEAIESFGDPETDAREMLEELRRSGRLENKADEPAEKIEEAEKNGEGAASYTGLSEEAINEAIKNIRPEEPVPVPGGADVAGRTRRKLVPALILIFAGIGIAIILTMFAVRVTGMTLSFFPWINRTDNHTIDRKISSLKVELSSADVFVTDSGSDMVTVNVPRGAKSRYTISFEGETLIIRSSYSPLMHLLPFAGSGNVEIGLPAKASAASYVLDSGSIETSSGDISVSGEILVKDTLSLWTSSGDIRIAGDNLASAVSGKLSIRTSSGDVRLDDIMAKNLEIRTSSGDVSSSESRVSDLDISTSSGEIDFSEAKLASPGLERFVIKSTSGDVKMELMKIPYIQTNTISGDERVEPSSASEGASERYVITTTSGDITVRSRK